MIAKEIGKSEYIQDHRVSVPILTNLFQSMNLQSFPCLFFHGKVNHYHDWDSSCFLQSRDISEGLKSPNKVFLAGLTKLFRRHDKC